MVEVGREVGLEWLTFLVTTRSQISSRLGCGEASASNGSLGEG